MRIHFFLRFHTKHGERLWIIGNHISLGEDKTKVALNYLNKDFWTLSVDIDDDSQKEIKYKYVYQNQAGEFIDELQFDRTINIGNYYPHPVKIYDVWNYPGELDNAFYTAPFVETLLPNAPKVKVNSEFFTHLFKVKAPLLNKDEVACILGTGKELKDWDTNAPILLSKQGDWWQCGIDLRLANFPLGYKYCVYNKKDKSFVRFEDGDNRICHEPSILSEIIILHDGFMNLPNNTWHGAGVAIPVFSLRSNNSFGVGEFTDIPLLVDWAKKIGLKLIQVLPVNDTTANHTWVDSYPYSAISAFALHPLFINLSKVAGKKNQEIINQLEAKRLELNRLAEVDYEQVMKYKLEALHKIYNINGEKDLKSDGYKKFYLENKDWLEPYGAFCYLRDKYSSPIFSEWKSNSTYKKAAIDSLLNKDSEAYNEIQFFFFVQYHLHLQLLEAVDYAHSKGIIMKGDIPIGVYRNGCDAWVEPSLYKMDMQAGAPPDDFAVHGQNWGFPTYNWENMQADGFKWWQRRFEQMSHYFDAFRIDHILGFFRIWSIPMHSVQGIMGKFDPCLPVHINEFGENGIWFDYNRYCNPFINEHVVYTVFGDLSGIVKDNFLQKAEGDNYSLLPDFNTQRKVADWFKAQKDNELNSRLKDGLFNLISNVILFEQEGSNGSEFHFRIAMEQTLSYQSLEYHTKEKLRALYVNYFFKRQNDFWRKESLKKLPQLKEATNMLVCGEDLGMVPETVPDVMRQLGILSLEIQRMPKQNDIEFFDVAYAPYLSVVTPSTHDMSTIRGWWQEDREVTQRFYNQILRQSGTAPFYCEPWINRAIVLQHLYSPAMWSIFQIQDILGMSDSLRRQMPEEERINIPANPHHYWRYRMHISLEDLIKEKEFTEELKGYIKNSRR